MEDNGICLIFIPQKSIKWSSVWNALRLWNGVGTTSHNLLNVKWPYLRLHNTYALCCWYGERYRIYLSPYQNRVRRCCVGGDMVIWNSEFCEKWYLPLWNATRAFGWQWWRNNLASVKKNEGQLDKSGYRQSAASISFKFVAKWIISSTCLSLPHWR